MISISQRQVAIWLDRRRHHKWWPDHRKSPCRHSFRASPTCSFRFTGGTQYGPIAAGREVDHHGVFARSLCGCFLAHRRWLRQNNLNAIVLMCGTRPSTPPPSFSAPIPEPFSPSELIDANHPNGFEHWAALQQISPNISGPINAHLIFRFISRPAKHGWI